MAISETVSRLVAMTDFVAFEYLCCDLLANYGRFAGLVPQGVGRIDGGKDAVLIARNGDAATAAIKRIIFHFSLRRDYEQKLFEDLNTVKVYGHLVDEVVFVTSQECTAAKQDKFKQKAQEKYGWSLEVYCAHWLRIPLDGEYQRLRRQYLGIDYDQHVFAPLETILAIPDRHPNRNDFECHAYYNDSILQHRIRALLEKNGSVLFWENLDVVRPH